MVGRFICNFLNGQHIICKFRHVQTVRVAYLHQCATNMCPAAIISCGARAASSSSNRPSSKLSDGRNNSGSQLLDAYHNNCADNLQLADLGKDAVAFALDSRGSRFIQHKLKRDRPTEKAQFVDALRGHVLTLAKQMYGGPVIQMALKSVDKASQMELINEISTQVIPLSLHEYGNWVIRSVLEHCTEQQKRPVLEQLLENVLTLATDQFGCYVIEHLIVHGLPEDRERIVQSLKGDIMKYAQHKFAFNVIEKCLICGTADQKKALFDKICVGGPQTLQNARQLMADEFGNLVIQKFFEYGTEYQKAQLVDALRGHVLTLALQIYGSHVIQMAFKSVDKASQMEIIEELTPRACVIRCIKDRYGAYVMNTIIELIEPEKLQFVVDAIVNSPSDSVASLSLHEYGNWVIRHVLEHCTEQQKRPVLDQLHDNLLPLVTHKYGCFVIRHLIEHGLPEDRERIVRSLQENVLTLATDQYGSFVIRHVKEHGLPEDRERILRSLHENLLTLVTDQYGNFVIRHVKEHGLPEDRERIVRSLQENVLTLATDEVTSMSTHEYGNLVIRRVLEHCTEQQKRPVLEQLHENLLTLVTDQYGNFVIRHVIEHELPEDRERIVRSLHEKVTSMSTHEYGCRVLQRLLEHCTKQQKRPMLEQLHENLLTLVSDQYGNFVIQHAIEHGLPEDRERIVQSLKGDIMKYAQHKFAFNVIRKCLICGTTDQKKALFDKICVGGPEKLQNARQLMADEFGTFIIQKFFEYGTEYQKARLVDALRGHVLTLALQMNGGPVIQMALKSVDKASQMEIIEELTPRACVIRCIKNRYGNHVMNTIIELIEPEQLQFVVDAIVNSPSASIAYHRSSTATKGRSRITDYWMIE